MHVILFGASGMVGQGVLLECLRDTSVERVLVIGRSSAGRQHAKLREVLVKDLFDVAAYAGELTGLD
ncbi:MAG TPA: saccharopine dehydrogenase NADP-binding domain-containing protein, partial [Acidobacteriaceae bacterium]|nr:saccharopine dehydrogenase NADP-binding domain-containing protein [Acidobacteriaceae bacterium]